MQILPLSLQNNPEEHSVEIEEFCCHLDFTWNQWFSITTNLTDSPKLNESEWQKNCNFFTMCNNVACT